MMVKLGTDDRPARQASRLDSFSDYGTTHNYTTYYLIEQAIIQGLGRVKGWNDMVTRSLPECRPHIPRRVNNAISVRVYTAIIIIAVVAVVTSDTITTSSLI
ncbi:unnamed protein product [Brugia pahangi]|uniref:Transposase n=1 Tax=Brugia pahangi TaxID=6280 RepID=A0A0N4TRJ8_BRUPA|nr:unnamed protein product [Brugia pahangi]